MPLVWLEIIPELCAKIVGNKARYISSAVKTHQIGHAGTNTGCSEPVCLSDSPASHKPTITPPHHAHTIRINKILFNEKIHTSHNISQVTECQQRGGGHCSLFVADPSLGDRAMTFLAVIPNQVKGITSTVYKDMGRMGLSTGGFTYKDVEVPEKYLLGEQGRGFYPCMEGFNVARVVVAAACLGGAEKCLEIAVDYAKQRKAFGQTLSRFQGIWRSLF